ncbi:helix-turn-helix transcriptional regulator [Streptomyces sp. 6N223]|uniref:helix-turn-helix transcriptional regulator n=1 Tax=Streptomyces sp. 6N223 TaxID=3457412 RepID=UPI003FD431EF
MRLFERETEINALNDLLDSSLRGTGSTAVISGATGMGKTALINAFAKKAADREVIVLSAAASRSERALQLGVISQLFRGVELPPSVAARVTEELDKGVLAATLPDSTADIVDRTTAPLLHGLCNELLALAQQIPVVITADDAHHADELSLRCLAQLTRRARSSRILVVLTQNAEIGQSNSVLQAEILHRPDCRQLRLGPLTRAGVAATLKTALDQPANQQLTDSYNTLSGGNPLLLRALIDDHRQTGTAPGGPEVGQCFEQAVLACLYRSGTEVLRLAQVFAVVGEEASCDVLEACVKPETDAANRAFRVLMATGLMPADKLPHQAVRTVVLNGMSDEDRRRLHARTAEVLYSNGGHAVTVARHVVAADGLPEPWSVPVLREAAQLALLDREPAFAVSCLRLALRDTAPGDQRRSELLIMMTSAQWQVDPLSVGRQLSDLIGGIRNRQLVGPQAMTPVSYLLWHGRIDEATEAMEHIGARAGTGTGTGTGARADTLGWHTFDEHFTSLSLPYTFPDLARRLNLDRRLPAGEDESTGDSTRQSIAALAGLLREGDDADTLVMAQSVLQAVRLDNETVGPLTAALVALLCLDRLDEAASWCDSLMEQAGARAAPTWHGVFGAIRSIIALHQGNLSAAEKHATAALKLISAKGWGVLIGVPLASLIFAATAMGRHEVADECLRIPVPEAMYQTPAGLLYLRARGRHHLARGRLYAALADFRSCGRLARQWDLDLPTLLPWRTDLASCYIEQGDIPQARRLATEQLDMLEDRRLARVRGSTLRLLAATHGIRERLGLLRQATDLAQDGGDQLELAHALTELSQTLAGLGEHGQARLVARRAHRVATHCGAQPLQRMLMRHNGSGLGLGDSGSESLSELSDAERRVAALASEGHTNRQIANRLYITISTVEQHLTQVYRKLNVKSRSELPVSLPQT